MFTRKWSLKAVWAAASGAVLGLTSIAYARLETGNPNGRASPTSSQKALSPEALTALEVLLNEKVIEADPATGEMVVEPSVLEELKDKGLLEYQDAAAGVTCPFTPK